ncbi:MAG TPA: SCO family protein [Burkholderiales bacterium]|jgi:protein SCO1/2|nr:SCO family protein [Burkholderiales bacterium]
MVRGIAALLLAAFAAGASGADRGSLKAGVFDPPRAAPEFSLRGTDGADFKLSRYRGKVVALGFGYTFCPDVCPTTLAELAQARKKLGADAKDFQVIYVTVDPERDSAARLKTYLSAFDDSFLGATGTPEQLADVRKAYGISIAKKTVEGHPSAYLVHHSSFVYFIDREGRLRAMLPFGGRSVEDIAHDIRALLKSERKP